MHDHQTLRPRRFGGRRAGLEHSQRSNCRDSICFFITFRENIRLAAFESSQTAMCNEDEAISLINVAISLPPVRFPTKEKSRHHRFKCPAAISPHRRCVWRRKVFSQGPPEDKQMYHTRISEQKKNAETIACVTFGAPQASTTNPS